MLYFKIAGNKIFFYYFDNPSFDFVSIWRYPDKFVDVFLVAKALTDLLWELFIASDWRPERIDVVLCAKLGADVNYCHPKLVGANG